MEMVGTGVVIVTEGAEMEGGRERNTEYNNSCTDPDRAPTIKSVPEIVLAKLAFAPVLIFSTPRKRPADNAIARIVMPTVKARANNDAIARRTIMTSPARLARCLPSAQHGQNDHQDAGHG